MMRRERDHRDAIMSLHPTPVDAVLPDTAAVARAVFPQVLSREWREFEGGVISRMFNALTRRVNAEGGYAMEQNTTKAAADATTGALFDDWFDPIELAVRTKVRGFIEAMIEEELSTALCPLRQPFHQASLDGTFG